MDNKMKKCMIAGVSLVFAGIAFCLANSLFSTILNTLVASGTINEIVTTTLFKVNNVVFWYGGMAIILVGAVLQLVACKKLGKKEVKKSVLCPYCGAPNPAENKFCVSCGNPTVKRCVNCGAELAPGEQFCGKCGVRVRDNTDPKD